DDPARRRAGRRAVLVCPSSFVRLTGARRRAPGAGTRPARGRSARGSPVRSAPRVEPAAGRVVHDLVRDALIRAGVPPRRGRVVAAVVAAPGPRAVAGELFLVLGGRGRRLLGPRHVLPDRALAGPVLRRAV